LLEFGHSHVFHGYFGTEIGTE